MNAPSAILQPDLAAFTLILGAVTNVTNVAQTAARLVPTVPCCMFLSGSLSALSYMFLLLLDLKKESLA